MRIYLDLLPQQKKQEVKRKKIFRQILKGELLFLVPFAVLIFILLSIYYILMLQAETNANSHSSQQLKEKYKQLEVYEEKFKQANSLVQTMGKIQAGHFYWHNFFQKLSETIPDNVYITDLSTKDLNVFLVGKAKAREDLLSLKNNLESEECFKNINVPLSNLVTKEDVDFQIDISINEDCLKKQQ